MTRWLREESLGSDRAERETADKVIRLQTVSQDLDKVTIVASRLCEWEGEREGINMFRRIYYFQVDELHEIDF